MIELYLVGAVVHNMKGTEEDKIVININCRKVWELLISKTLKASQLAEDGGSIITKIIDLKSKSKI